MTKKPTGLGKGLDAIFQNSGISPLSGSAIIKSKDSTVSEILIDKIKPNPSQPRADFDNEALEELAQSITRLGIIQPITLRENADGTYLIISGERRYRASKIAKLTTIPAYVRKANDQELLEMALVENIQRQDLNALEIALSFERLLKDCNLTQEQLSDRVGKKRSTIANYVRLLALPTEIQAAVKQNLITMGHARAIASLQNTADQLFALENVIEGQLSVRETETLVAKLAQPKLTANQTKTPLSDEVKSLSKQLTQKLQGKVSITQTQKGDGKITIRFEDARQLETIKKIIIGN